MSEYVYAVHSVDKGLVKIGYSKQPEIRVNALRYAWGAPLPLMILGVIQIDRARLVERALHWHFAEYREQGEWFRLHPSDIVGWMDESRLIQLTEEFLNVHPEVSDALNKKRVRVTPFNRAVGKRLKQRREGFAGIGMSLAQLARRTGLNPATIWNYENGRGMTLDAAYRIARALGFSGLDELVRACDD